MFRSAALILIAVTLVSGGAFPKRLARLRPDGRIIGGTETTIERNPWQVSLQGLYEFHNCGGSIISPDTIVTAAHCIDGAVSLFYEVVAGTADLLNVETRVKVKNAIVHEQANGLDYDVAIIKLAENLTFSDQISAIELPSSEPNDGDAVIVSGWGILRDSDLTTTNILHEVEVNIVNRTVCAQNYADVDGADVTDRMICAGVENGGKDSCSGDSGGPLQKDGVLLGIVSWGVGCAQPGYPGVYTNVHKVVGWIKEKAGL